MNAADLLREQGKIRRRNIRQMLYSIYPRPLGAGLLREQLDPDVTCSPAELARELDYLLRKGHIVRDAVSSARSVEIVRLTAAGIESLEGHPRFPPDRRRDVRMLRLRILQVLDLLRPHAAGMELLQTGLNQDADLDTSDPAVRRALHYLAEREMVAPVRDAPIAEGPWQMTAAGIDYLGGDGDGVEGIARPTGW